MMDEFRKRAEDILYDNVFAENDCFKYFNEYIANTKDKQLLSAMILLTSFSKSYPVILPVDGIIIQLSSDNWLIGDSGKFRTMTNEEQEALL